MIKQLLAATALATTLATVPAIAQQQNQNENQNRTPQATQQDRAMNQEVRQSVREMERAERNLRQAAERGVEKGSPEARELQKEARAAFQNLDRVLARMEGGQIKATDAEIVARGRANLKQTMQDMEDDIDVIILADALNAGQQTLMRASGQDRVGMNGRKGGAEVTAGAKADAEAGPRTAAEGEDAELVVEQPPAQVEVEQTPPRITVVDPEPRVIVEQDRPEVSVNQAKPEVKVQKAQPEIEVESGGKAEVTIKETELPEDVAVKAQNDEAETETETVTVAERTEKTVQEGQRGEVQIQQDSSEVEVEPGEADVQVVEGDPNVTVEQQAPDVAVNQPRPEVSVDQPAPEVEIEGETDAQVSVREADRSATEQQSGQQAMQSGQQAMDQSGQTGQQEEELEVAVVEGDADASVEGGAGMETGMSDTDAEATAEAEAAAGASGDRMVRETDRAAEGRIDEFNEEWELVEAEDNQVVGMDVYSSRGDEVGEIERVLRDENGQIDEVVVEFGGFLGLGDEEVVVPQDRMRMEPGNDRVIVEMTEEELEQLPEYVG
ncbi:MAG: hypothetical protein TEF_17360 [Rhizobiales bacterium NRL2]|jgi:sporulation protein YlmC with PRC-barrel domain|nr:MAG: hypothetical protein TEF_17360 [Rhizobiales bacterium NRL2]